MVCSVLLLVPIGCDVLLKNYPIFYYDELMIKTSKNDDYTISQELLKGVCIEQTFYCRYIAIESININTFAYGRKNEGELVVDLIEDDSGTTIYKWVVDLHDILDDDYLSLKIDNGEIINTQDKYLTLKIYAIPKVEYRSISLGVVDNQYEYGTYICNGEEQDNDLLFYVNGYSSSRNLESERIEITIINILALYYMYRKKTKGDFDFDA